jgi:hypothetical protein
MAGRRPSPSTPSRAQPWCRWQIQPSEGRHRRCWMHRRCRRWQGSVSECSGAQEPGRCRAWPCDDARTDGHDRETGFDQNIGDQARGSLVRWRSVPAAVGVHAAALGAGPAAQRSAQQEHPARPLSPRPWTLTERLGSMIIMDGVFLAACTALAVSIGRRPSECSARP